MKRRKVMIEIIFVNEKDLALKIMLDHLEFIEKKTMLLDTEIRKIAKASDDVKLLVSITGMIETFDNFTMLFTKNKLFRILQTTNSRDINNFI